VDRLISWYRLTSSSGAVVALVAANLVPLFGVLFLSWSVWNILIIYWLENGIVGAFNVLKMAYARGDETDAPSAVQLRIAGKPPSMTGKVALIPFFIVHYGLFWFVHGVFVLTMPFFTSLTANVTGGGFDPTGPFIPLDPAGGGFQASPAADLATVAFAVLALTVSHGLSFWWNYLVRGEYRRTTVGRQMFAPYPRLALLHLTIIIGGIAISMFGAPVLAIVILVGLKTLMDVGFHLAEHRKIDTDVPTIPD
jgi:hypothetical protein